MSRHCSFWHWHHIYIYTYIYIYLPDIKKSKFAKIPADCQANDFNFWKTLLWSTAHHGLKEVCFTCEDTQQDQDNVMGQISLYSLLTDIHLEPFFSKKSFSTLRTFKKLHTKNLLACRVLIVRSFRCTRF